MEDEEFQRIFNFLHISETQFVDEEDSYRSELYDYFEEGNHYTEECFNYFNNEEDDEEVDFCDYCEESGHCIKNCSRHEDEDDDDDYWSDSYFLESSLQEKPNLCEYCGNEGHGVWECYELDENNTVSIPEVNLILDLKKNDFSTLEKDNSFNHSEQNKFCEVCNGVGHLWKECPKSQNTVFLGKKSRQRERRKEKKLLSNNIENVDWETIGKVNGLGKEKETPKRFTRRH
ncbi:13971_t:CDS:1 [Funneliformis caledonium]|uniref:13971_t:CDS:1 n=1 Tax=Funneliformis caledonium TaxID=1117310 RepID=A0A9N9CDD6_9GLOM|nr:13971_t:CDS:1 [Funneliformis caledonium]